MGEQEVPVQIEEETGEEDAVQEVQQELQTQAERPINTLIKTNFKEQALLEIIIYQEPVPPRAVIIPESTLIVQMHPQQWLIH